MSWSDEFDDALGSTGEHCCDGEGLITVQVNPFSRLLFVAEHGQTDADENTAAATVRLFADGVEFRCSRALAERLCRRAATSIRIDTSTSGS